jgi:hypothetical protein
MHSAANLMEQLRPLISNLTLCNCNSVNFNVFLGLATTVHSWDLTFFSPPQAGSSCPDSSANISELLNDMGLSTEGLTILECLTIITRSAHNCRVFNYYGGVQKVTALLKGTYFIYLGICINNYRFISIPFSFDANFTCI